MLWDVFCRVVDNFGDIGVCWRLCADLAERGERVRLWADDPSALAWMAPGGRPGVEVRAWATEAPEGPLGDVVVEAFGCDPPEAFVARMAAAAQPPAWINLEYLSAESYVERSHGLPSPQRVGLTKWFFYPGFTEATGGLLRERDLLQRQERFDARAWLTAQGLAAAPDQRIASLYCYPDNPALPRMIDALARQPTLLLVAAGAPALQVSRILGAGLARGALRAVLLPLLSQVDYDHLLWASDLNFVRGEDSFVRAQWAGKPFVWQVYPQTDGAHAAKLSAFADLFLATASTHEGAELRDLWGRWNAFQPAAGLSLPPLAPWGALCERWRGGLLAQADLCSRLQGFARRARAERR